MLAQSRPVHKRGAWNILMKVVKIELHFFVPYPGVHASKGVQGIIAKVCGHEPYFLR